MIGTQVTAIDILIGQVQGAYLNVLLFLSHRCTLK